MQERLGIAEVASVYKISARTLRYYEEIGILQSMRQTRSKYREYSREHLQRLEIILLLRRLSFSVKAIVEILDGDEAHLRALLREKIMESSRMLMEARETDQLLRDLVGELDHKPLAAVSISYILSKYTYLTNKTERMIPMNIPNNEKYLILLSASLVGSVCIEGAGDLVNRIGALREKLKSESVEFERVRIMDHPELSDAIQIRKDGVEVWSKEVSPAEGAVCVDEVIDQLEQLVRNN